MLLLKVQEIGKMSRILVVHDVFVNPLGVAGHVGVDGVPGLTAAYPSLQAGQDHAMRLANTRVIVINAALMMKCLVILSQRRLWICSVHQRTTAPSSTCVLVKPKIAGTQHAVRDGEWVHGPLALLEPNIGHVHLAENVGAPPRPHPPAYLGGHHLRALAENIL